MLVYVAIFHTLQCRTLLIFMERRFHKETREDSMQMRNISAALKRSCGATFLVNKINNKIIVANQKNIRYNKVNQTGNCI